MYGRHSSPFCWKMMGWRETESRRASEHPTYSLSTIITQLLTASPPSKQLLHNSLFSLMKQQEEHRSAQVKEHTRMTAGSKHTTLALGCIRNVEPDWTNLVEFFGFFFDRDHVQEY